MKFSKSYQPRRKAHRKQSMYSKEYIEERKNEMYALLATAKTQEEKNAIMNAFSVSVNP